LHGKIIGNALKIKRYIPTARLTKGLNKAILEELDQHDKLQRAVSAPVIAKRTIKYQQACQQTRIATQQLEDFQFLYFCLVDQFNIFDKQAQARQQTTAIEEAKLALSLLKTLEIAQLIEVVEKIENKVDELFNFLPKAKLVQFQLEAQLGEIATFFWIYAWQNDKKSRKIKKYANSKIFVFLVNLMALCNLLLWSKPLIRCLDPI